MSKRNKELITCEICDKSIKNLGQHLYYSHPELTVKEYYDLYLKKENEEICPTCGGDNHFQSIRKGYTKHCCPKCAQRDSQVRAKQENTNLNRYDHKYAIATTQAKEKSKQTKKDRYGSETYNNPEKMKQTKYDTYGEYFINKEKTEATNLKRYGVRCTFQSREARLKAIHTMRKNGNRSSYEDYLEQFFITNNIKYEQEYNKDTRYPYHCDFYLPDTDTFIEINVYWTHGKHWFDEQNEDDIKVLKIWKEKANSGLKQYESAIDIWTNLDVEKRIYAENNNLNYIVLWNKKDIDKFISLYKI